MAVLSDAEFESFGRIARVSRQCVITEKIDGTNAQVFVGEDGTVAAGSRNRWLSIEDDNFQFASWVKANESELRDKLGPGRHFGEWWGVGIQRGYGIYERRFSLFNTSRWLDPAVRPACCQVVPVLYEGEFTTGAIDLALQELADLGSVARPAWMKPEGVVVYHKAANVYFKKTIGDDGHKGGQS